MDKKELFKKLENINEDAHNYVYDLWEEANQLEEENGYTDEVEDKKILASDKQASSFKEILEKWPQTNILQIFFKFKVLIIWRIKVRFSRF
jgi:hypothetical protein